MVANENELSASLERLGRMLSELNDVIAAMLREDPEPLVAVAESCWQGIDAIRADIEDYVSSLPPSNATPVRRDRRGWDPPEILDDLEYRFSLQQMGLLMGALWSLKLGALGRNPGLFAAMAEGDCELIGRIRTEILTYLRKMKAAG